VADDVTNLRITVEAIHSVSLRGNTIFFVGNAGGVQFGRSATFTVAPGQDLSLGAQFQKVIDVRGQNSIQVNVTAFSNAALADVGSATATVSLNASTGQWAVGHLQQNSDNNAFQLKYQVEEILALDPARPDTAVVCRVVAGAMTCSTISGAPVRVISITATVVSTPPNTARAAPPTVANAWPAPTDLTFVSTTALPRGPLVQQAADFAMPNALVVIRNSAGPIALVAQTDPPNVDVLFTVVRATDDVAAVGGAGDLPTLSNTGNTTATLATDQRGSFYVLAFVDANRNQKRDDIEPGIILPVVIAECHIQTPATELRSAANPANIAVNMDGVVGRVHAANYQVISVTTGVFNAGLGGAGVGLDADVLLIGGGPDGRRGLDRVFTGWANNFTVVQYQGTYFNGNLVQRIQIDNIQDANGAGADTTPAFITSTTNPFANPPNPIAFPILDTGRFSIDPAPGGPNDPAFGGVNICFVRSNESAPTAQATMGEKRTVQALDSPGWNYDRHHPNATVHSNLQSVNHTLNSTTRLVAWTNTTGGAQGTPGTPNSTGFRTYTVIAKTDWVVQANFNMTGMTGNINLNISAAPAPTITANNTNFDPAVPAQNDSMEVRPPLTLQTRVYDAE
jgi:hypothetical protein